MILYSSQPIRLLCAALLVFNTANSAPVKPTDMPADAALIQVVNGKTRVFAIGTSILPMNQTGTATSSSQRRPKSSKSSGGGGGQGLIAAEVTEAIPANGGSVLVKYYQEKNTQAAYTSYATIPAKASKIPIETGLFQADIGPVAQKWVDLHNSARAIFGAGRLQWREGLVAKAKANAILCTGDHSNAGENIAAQSGELTPELTVQWWMAEEAFYDWRNPGFNDKTGHFTQVVWKRAQYVGCYTARCEAGTVFEKKFGVSYQSTCEYDPAGNYINEGQFAANVGKRVSGSMPWLP